MSITVSVIEIIALDTYRVDNGHGTVLTLINKSGDGWSHWEVHSLSARTQALHGNRNLAGVRTYSTLAEVEDQYKAFRGIAEFVASQA